MPFAHFNLRDDGDAGLFRRVGGTTSDKLPAMLEMAGDIGIQNVKMLVHLLFLILRSVRM